MVRGEEKEEMIVEAPSLWINLLQFAQKYDKSTKVNKLGQSWLELGRVGLRDVTFVSSPQLTT